MLDIGWSELLVIGSIALIVVGPKELPRMLRTLGQYAAKARSMAREFQRSMEDAAREADISEMTELKDTANELRRLKRTPFDHKPKTARKEAEKAPAGAAASKAPASPPASEGGDAEAAKPAGAASKSEAADEAKSA